MPAPAIKRSRWHRLRSELGFAALSLLIALAIGFLFLLLTGKDALQAYSVLLAGPLARLPRTGRWLDVACNLTVAGLAFAIPYRARLINFGVASQALLGGFAAAVAAGLVGIPIAAQLAAVGAALLAGFALGVLPGAMKAYLGANEIVVTLMLSFIVSQALSLALDVMFGAGLFGFFRGLGPHNGFPQIREVTDLATGTFHLGVIVVIVAVLAAWLLLERTPFGYAVRMTGANERFARYGGINTRRATMLSFGVGGAFAGLAGANLALGAPRRVRVGGRADVRRHRRGAAGAQPAVTGAGGRAGIWLSVGRRGLHGGADLGRSGSRARDPGRDRAVAQRAGVGRTAARPTR